MIGKEDADANKCQEKDTQSPAGMASSETPHHICSYERKLIEKELSQVGDRDEEEMERDSFWSRDSKVVQIDVYLIRFLHERKSKKTDQTEKG